MSALGESTVRVTQHVRRLRGVSQPVLVEASDGLLYVVKFHHPENTPNLPLNESLGHETYRACQLLTPLWSPVAVSSAFIDHHPECWWEVSPGERQRPASGVYFGSRFRGGGGRRLLEILPGDGYHQVINHESFWRAWVIDICARHADHRQAVFAKLEAGQFEAIFIDHSHMFGGPAGDQEPDFLTSRYLDRRIYRNPPDPAQEALSLTHELDPDRLWATIRTLPTDWKTPSALQSIEVFLHRVADPRILERIWTSAIAHA